MSISPIRRFLQVETSASFVLLFTTAVALLMANTAATNAYQGLLHTPIFASLDVHFLTNEGLMTFFFLVVGLELRREAAVGELSTPRRAFVPAFAALGGMLVPALVYSALNRNTPALRGWGIPTATDIAFAVGILTLLGKRVNAAMRILLLALAVVDDLVAVLVITIGYAARLHTNGLPFLALAALSLWALRTRIRSLWLLLLPLSLLWFGLHRTGVHPAISGVAVALALPFDRTREEVNTVVHLQRQLHPWSAFAIMPLFAFVNAGVRLTGVHLSGAALSALLGVTLGLALGKTVGVFSFVWLAGKTKLAVIPEGISALPLLVVSITAGIGFTMSLFIAERAFSAGEYLTSAKLGILTGSGLCAVLSLAIGRALLPLRATDATSLEEAETSTER
jgi:Na+:H+ antiporter, NhaA family